MTAQMTFEQLLELVPEAGAEISWPAIEAVAPDRFAELGTCPQDPRHHGEGDVLTHTRMVVSALTRDAEWACLPDLRRAGLFWAAVLHDIGKPATTRTEEDGSITSRGHSRAGAQIAREILREIGAPFAWREEICGLIVAHQLPFWLIEREDPERLAIRTSWECNTHDLCLHARADALGRICDDQEDVLERVELARLVFQEAGCLGTPYPFANDESRVVWAARDDRDPSYPAHEDHSCTVTMTSGLPGSGKDSWIAAHAPDLPVVSLDDIRVEMKVDPTDNQGRVIQEAKERARVHLRTGQDFVWNATNITRQMREPLLSLFQDYRARTRVVYVEVPPGRHRQQNRSREAMVPEQALRKLAMKLEPPGRLEAHEVIYAVDTSA